MRQPSSRVRKTPLAAGRTIVTYLPVGSVVSDPNNPRHHSPKQIRAIARSIEAFGFNVPILVDKANRIVAGHGRLDAAKRLKLAEAPVIRLEHLTEAQAKAFMLADNKLSDLSNWDEPKLAVVLKELSEIALDFEIEVTGFDRPEIDFRIQSLESPDDSADSADEFEAAEGPPVSRPEDLWILGDHRLLCGNALDPQAYDAILAGEKAVAVFTDPANNLPVKGHATGKGATKNSESEIAGRELTEDKFCKFFIEAFNLLVSHSVERATFFACMDWRRLLEIVSAIPSLGCSLLDVCVSVGSKGETGSLYRSAHELVFVFGRRDATRGNNVHLGKPGRKRTNVWNYPGRRTASDRQAHSDGQRRDPRRYAARRHRSRSLQRQRHDDPRRRKDGTARLRDRTRSEPRRHRHRALGAHDEANRPSREWQDLRGNARRARARQDWNVRAMRPGSKKPHVERSARRAKGHGRRRRARQESTFEIMQRLLTRRVSITVRDKATRVPAAKAIVLQLVQKVMSGNARAWRVLLKYQEFANSGRADRSTQLRFVESNYTRAVANSSSSSDDG
jgi:hypothetical protein